MTRAAKAKTTEVKTKLDDTVLKVDSTKAAEEQPVVTGSTTTSAKTEEKKAEPVKKTEPAKKAEPVKKAEPAKKAAKEPAKKAVVKEELKPEIYVQYAEHESNLNELIGRVKQVYVEAGHRVSSIKALQLYVKPEESAVYYVINGKEQGRLDLF